MEQVSTKQFHISNRAILDKDIPQLLETVQLVVAGNVKVVCWGSRVPAWPATAKRKQQHG